MAVETSVYSPFNNLTWLLAREYFIEFRCSDNFILNINLLEIELLWFEYIYRCYTHKTSQCNCFISVLIRSNRMQQYAGIYLLQVYSTCFGRPSRPSSGVQKTVTATSGKVILRNGATTFLQRDLIRPRWRKVFAPLRNMTCTRDCIHCFLYSWWWARWTPQTCRVNLQ